MHGHDQASLNVLIGDRHRTVADSLGKIVGALGDVDVTTSVDTSANLVELARKVSPDVAIIDLALSPSCSLVSALHSLLPDTRIVVMAERESHDAADLLKALEAGAVGAMYKEASFEQLARALKSSSSSTPVVSEEATGLLLGSYLDALGEKRRKDVAMIEALAAAVEARDATTGMHLGRASELATICLDEIDPALSKNEEVAYGFMLHDVGKIGVPDAILNKRGPLTESEWEVMRQHPTMGAKIVEPIGFSSATTDVILCHHERWDGNGYPNGLSGEQIPLAARTFSIADAFDAMTSDRPYRSALSRAETLDVLRSGAGSAHDPEIVDLFVSINN